MSFERFIMLDLSIAFTLIAILAVILKESFSAGMFIGIVAFSAVTTYFLASQEWFLDALYMLDVPTLGWVVFGAIGLFVASRLYVVRSKQNTPR